MSEQPQKTQIEINLTDGAILFTKKGIELLVPNMQEGDNVPEHLYPLFALASKLHDKEFMEQAWEQFNKQIEEIRETK